MAKVGECICHEILTSSKIVIKGQAKCLPHYISNSRRTGGYPVCYTDNCINNRFTYVSFQYMKYELEGDSIRVLLDASRGIYGRSLWKRN